MVASKKTVLMLRTSQNPDAFLPLGRLEEFGVALRRARSCLYAVLCQHDTHEFSYSAPKYEHRFGFAVVRGLTFYEVVVKGKTLYGVAWKFYAPIACADLYPTFRRAFHYATPDEVPFDLDALPYQPVDPGQAEPVGAAPEPHAPEPVDLAALPTKLSVVGPGGVVIEITIRAA